MDDLPSLSRDGPPTYLPRSPPAFCRQVTFSPLAEWIRPAVSDYCVILVHFSGGRWACPGPAGYIERTTFYFLQQHDCLRYCPAATLEPPTSCLQAPTLSHVGMVTMAVFCRPETGRFFQQQFALQLASDSPLTGLEVGRSGAWPQTQLHAVHFFLQHRLS